MRTRTFPFQAHNRPQPSVEVLRAYDALDGVPLSIIDTAVCVETREQAQQMATAFVGERQGMTSTPKYPTPEGMPQMGSRALWCTPCLYVFLYINKGNPAPEP